MNTGIFSHWQTHWILMSREELKVFAGEVVRFGNRCKDPQWHNLDRYFDKYYSILLTLKSYFYVVNGSWHMVCCLFHKCRLGSELTPQSKLKEEVEAVMQHLMTMVQYTAVSNFIYKKFPIWWPSLITILHL